MKQYELTFLIHPDLEMNTEAVVSKVKELIDTNGGKVTKEANEGKKKLTTQTSSHESSPIAPIAAIDLSEPKRPMTAMSAPWKAICISPVSHSGIA